MNLMRRRMLQWTSGNTKEKGQERTKMDCIYKIVEVGPFEDKRVEVARVEDERMRLHVLRIK